MERTNNFPDDGDIKKHLSIDGIPVKAYDAITSGTISRKVGLGILAQLLAAGAISQEVYAKWAEKVVVAAGDNLVSIVNQEEGTSIGDFVSGWANYALFMPNSYISTDGQNITTRNNKTLGVTESVPFQGADVIADLGNGFVAVSGGYKIMFRNTKDGSQQIINFASGEYSITLTGSNGIAYVAVKRNDGKYEIRVFVKGAKGEYEEMAEKIELQGNADSMVIHNGKIAVIIYNKVYVYNQDTNQLEYESNALGGGSITFFGARPGTNEIFISAYLPRQLVSMDLTTHEIKPLETVENIVGPDYGIGKCGFSKDGSRLIVHTGSYYMPEQYVLVLELNPNGTIAKITKSPTVTQSDINDCTVDTFDTDEDQLTNSVDNCPYTANPAQADTNANAIGDACEDPNEYAAEKGYESYEETDGHVIYSKGGGVDVVDMGDVVVVSPAPGAVIDFEIISNGEPQTKPLAINVPKNTSYSFNFLEGQGDIAETAPVDCPEGKGCEGETEEKGVLIGVSGTHVIGNVAPAGTQAEEGSVADEGTAADEGAAAEEGTAADEGAAAEEVQAADDLKPDVAEEAGADVAELEPDAAEEVGTDAIQPDAIEETVPDLTQPDVIQQDNVSANDTHETISADTYIPPNGGGGCKMNPNSMYGGESVALTLAMMAALGMKHVKWPILRMVDAARRKIDGGMRF